MSLKPVLAALLLVAPVAQGHAQSLEQRVERMEAESEIRRMLVEYGAFLDARDYASYAGLFAEDGTWTGGFGSFTGPEAIRSMLEGALGIPEPGFENHSSFHMITNPIIEIDGDRAQVSSKYIFWTRSPLGDPAPLVAGRYVDDFVREGGTWKIARRTTFDEIPYRDPASGEGGPPPSLGIAQLQARLQRAEDILAIQRILVEYSARIDRQDFDAYADLFAENGVWQNGATVRTGRDEIKAMLTGLFGTPPPGFVNTESYHLVSNPQVDVDGDHATARSRHLLIMRGEGGEPVPELAGFYEDELIRVNGEWKILRRVDNPVMPSPAEWMAEIRARNGGG